MNSLAPLPKNRRAFYGLVTFALYLLSMLVFLTFRANSERDVATRQQTSSGIIDECEQRGRGGIDRFCHYMFPVGDEQYLGINQAQSGAVFGQTVVVYYDRRNPRISALEDFSEQSRAHARFAYIYLLALVATVAFMIRNGTTSREA